MDIVCFSHLRWDFVFQRPQHLFSHFAKHFRVFFFEEPVYDAEEHPFLSNQLSTEGVWVIKPHLSKNEDKVDELQNKLLNDYFQRNKISDFIAWYYTPMALSFTGDFQPVLTVYDCMDELSAFKNAPSIMKEREKELLSRADVVFTGGHSLYESKKHLHPSVYPFPSSIDKRHFGKARTFLLDPPDQYSIPHPRLGFFGVIDERMDLDLLASIAEQKPEWQIIIIGPVVKIDPATLPAYSNIHYLGPKTYEMLPSYLAGWDIAIMPFAINESTRYISPTKTPEYLAGGKPVVSTPIRDVVTPYGDNGFVHIAKNAGEFIACVEKELSIKDKEPWLSPVDDFLAVNSWECTVSNMMEIINAKLASKNIYKHQKEENEYV